mgnify:CR=1 FL=1
MKTKILLFACLVLLMCSCRDKNTPELQVPYVEYGWDNFPFERINCYFPEEGTVQMYVSDKDNSFNLTAGKLDAEYHARPGSDPVEDADGGFPSSTEMYSALVCFTNNATNDLIAPQSLRFSIDDNRKTLAIMVTTTQRLLFGYEAKNNSSKPDALFQYLGDTITLQTELRDKSGKIEVVPNAAILVKNKGIIMYKTLDIDTETGKFLGFDETWTLVD